MSKAPRVMVGRLWHESNGFNPQTTTQAAFQIQFGNAMLDGVEASGSTLGGIVGQLTARGADVLPSLSMTAPPGGLVTHELFAQISRKLIECAVRHQPDAIALELHGACGTTELPDAEGDLLTALRKAVGPDVPIGIGLDLHAHVTDAMLAAVDVCVACKENPHSDVVACGEKVADCLLAVLDGRLVPVTTMAKVPMILPGAADTASGPLAEIHAQARRLTAEHPAVWDISVFNVFRYVDDHDIGQAVVVLTNGEADGGVIAEELVGAFWRERDRFIDELLSIDDALTHVAEHRAGTPFVLADMGDRVLAGAPGDSTAILAAALKRDDRLKGAIPITDPESAAGACEAGTGSRVKLDVGGKITPGFSPLKIEGLVLGTSGGEFTLAGPFQGGERSTLGPTAVVQVADRLSLLLTTHPAFSHDPAVFTSQGIALDDLDFIVVKSGYHFKLNFAAVATPLLVRTPGVGYYTKGLLAYERARFWPENDVGEPEVSARTFHRPQVPVSG